MQEQAIQFFSDQITLRGTIYLPDDFDISKSYSSVIVCSGYTGLNAIYPRLFAEALTRKQLVVLGFDYRGCGESDGERGKLLLEEQVKDIRNSITFLKYQSSVKLGQIGILGWGMGAGLVIAAAEKNPLVKAVAGINGFYRGESFLKDSFSEEGFQLLLQNMEDDRKQRVFKGKLQFTDPFEAYPLDPETRDVVDEKLRPVKNYEIQTAFELGESIYFFDSIEKAKKLEQPLFIAHGKKNKLHSPALAQELMDNLTGADFYEIQGKHNDFMSSDHPEFIKLTDTVSAWYFKHL